MVLLGTPCTIPSMIYLAFTTHFVARTIYLWHAQSISSLSSQVVVNMTTVIRTFLFGYLRDFQDFCVDASKK